MTIQATPSSSLLFITLPVGNDASAEMLCPDEVVLFNEKWLLLGRISATTIRGGHFFAHVKRDDPGIMPGFYLFDDLSNGGRAVFDNNQVNIKANSCYLAYGKQ